MNLVEGLQAANNKSRKFLQELDETAELMHGPGKTAKDDPGLAISASVTEALIQETEAAIASGDVMRMLKAAGAHGLGERETGDDA